MTGLQATMDRIPHHLRRYVVEQDYSAYDAVDQAVWRFTLLQTYNQLKTTAEPSYIKGLEQTGIFLDRIPRIEEMNDCLSAFGWGAVCVDGFIPPRAFQEFQALGIMTIAAEIRTADHLAYTPAPDIIHEAAGHSPIVPNDVYRSYLQRFGEVSKQAFSSKEDLAVYEAIRNLSVVKEDPNAGKAKVEEAEHLLLTAMDGVTFTSEAALLSRLHWWTVEYGLIGTPEDYKIYGAGILSSVGESFMLHLPEVKKRRLRSRCVEMDYDITEPQPQLYVVESFDELHHILDEVVADFSFNVGGRLAVNRAVNSGEVGTVVLNSGLQIMGLLTEMVAGSYLRFEGPVALGCNNKILKGHGRDRHPHGYGAAVGRLENGVNLSELTPYGLDRLGYRGPGTLVELNYRSGVRIKGNLDRVEVGEEGTVRIFTFSNCTVTHRDRVLFQPEWGEYDLTVGEYVESAFAGPVDVNYWPESEFSGKRVPKPKQYSESSLELLDLYNQLNEAKGAGPKALLQAVEQGFAALEARHADHWLLPWNMVEALVREDCGVRSACRLKDFMLKVEAKRYHEVPVHMGLKYLGLL